MKLDKGMIDEVEHAIFPTLEWAVTIPVVNDDGSPTSLVIFVAVAPGTNARREPASQVLKTVAALLELKS